MSNQDGLQQIHMNLEDKAICSSVGIVERALTQVDEYDFMNDYVQTDAGQSVKKDIVIMIIPAHG